MSYVEYKSFLLQALWAVTAMEFRETGRVLRPELWPGLANRAYDAVLDLGFLLLVGVFSAESEAVLLEKSSIEAVQFLTSRCQPKDIF